MMLRILHGGVNHKALRSIALRPLPLKGTISRGVFVESYDPPEPQPILRGISKTSDMSQLHASLPTKKTTVILRKIPSSVTQTSLREALVSVDTIRKIELEPGCVLHFSNEAAAERTISSVHSALNCEATISKTQLPSLLLQNLPSDVSVQSLKKSFAKFNPKFVNLTTLTFQIQGLITPDEAITTAQALEHLSFHDQKIKTNVFKIGDQNYCVNVFNFHNNELLSDPSGSGIEEAIRKVISPLLPASKISKHVGAHFSIQVRLGDDSNSKEVKSALSRIEINGEPLVVSSKLALKKPTLFVRNTKDVPRETIQEVLLNAGSQRVVFNYTVGQMRSDLTIAHFASPEEAFSALKKLKGVALDGKQLSVSYKEIEEPAVMITNLPENIGLTAIEEKFSPLSIASTHIIDETKALMIFTHPHDQELAMNAYNRKMIGGNTIHIHNHAILDSGFDVSLASGKVLTPADLALIQEKLIAANINTKAVTLNTNTSAFIAFLNTDDAIKAQDGFIKGTLVLDSDSMGFTGIVTTRLSGQPSFTVEVLGLDPEIPAKEIEKLISDTGDKSYHLRTDRSATVKFRRNMHVINGIKLLSKIQIDGATMSAKRYHQVLPDGDSAYDESGDEDEFDRLTLRALLADHMSSDPATRFQIAKNEFDRALVNSKAHKDLSYLIKRAPTPAMQEEAENLLKTTDHRGDLPVASKQRLFELFIQRDDMYTFAADFKDMMAFFGNVNEEDPFNWTQFSISDPQEWLVHAHYREAMNRRELDLQQAYKNAQGKRKSLKDYLAGIVEQDDTKRLEIWNKTKLELKEEKLAKRKEAREKAYQLKHGIAADEDDLNGEGDDYESDELSVSNDDSSSSDSESESEIESDTDDYQDGDNDFRDNGRGRGRGRGRDNNYNGDRGLISFSDDISGGSRKQSRQEKLRSIALKHLLAGEPFNMADLDFMDTDEAMLEAELSNWSTIVLDTDIVQHTLPRNREQSDRCLVSIGNMRGVGGFGMGKGKDIEEAAVNAFKAALKNLTFVDLYDNYGLAHDLHGKYNGCHCYIRATPRSRKMVATPWVEMVLKQFGISSASVKILGRRDPYASIRALHNALSKHQNIDETAKQRGQRYLTLKWAHDNGIGL